MLCKLTTYVSLHTCSYACIHVKMLVTNLLEKSFEKRITLLLLGLCSSEAASLKAQETLVIHLSCDFDDDQRAAFTL